MQLTYDSLCDDCEHTAWRNAEFKKEFRRLAKEKYGNTRVRLEAVMSTDVVKSNSHTRAIVHMLHYDKLEGGFVGGDYEVKVYGWRYIDEKEVPVGMMYPDEEEAIPEDETTSEPTLDIEHEVTCAWCMRKPTPIAKRKSEVAN